MGADVLTPTFGLKGGFSTSFTTTNVADVQGSITNALLVAGLGAGPLLTFLSTSFANEAAADLAFRAIGGQVAMRQRLGTASTSTFLFEWVCTTAVPAVLITAAGSTDYVLEVTISCSHSIVT